MRRLIGFPIPNKENECRRAVIPPDLAKVENRYCLIFETGYGQPLGFSDEDYLRAGSRVASRREVCECPVVCSPKPILGDEYFQPDKMLFGWIHAVQGLQITDALMTHRMTAVAWEDMFENGRHCFWRNNEIAGEAAVLHAVIKWGRIPLGCHTAIIGRGNVSRGAVRTLERLGCYVTIYDRNTVGLIREEIGRYDIVVNAVLWDVFRTDHIVYEEDLVKMKPGSLIIDISCDAHMGVESSVPTTIENPVYWHKGILHYVVDHTPALFFRTASESISRELVRYLDQIVESRFGRTLEKATIIRCGEILDERIVRFQTRQPSRPMTQEVTKGNARQQEESHHE